MKHWLRAPDWHGPLSSPSLVPLKGARLLVLGGTGFIGGTCARLAAAAGVNTVVASASGRFAEAETGGLHDLRAVRLDLADENQVKSFLESEPFDYIVNAAGYIDHSNLQSGGVAVFHQHLHSCLYTARYCDRKRLRAFVQLGSSDEYGNQKAPQVEDMREAPIAPYSAGKVAATHLLGALFRQEAFPSTVLRIFLAYGGGQDAKRFIPQVIQGCLADKEFPASEGQQLRDFTFVDDIADGIFCALSARAARGEVINLASGRPVTIRSVVQLICNSIGKGKPAFGDVPYRPGENMELFANVDKAKNILGWQAVTPLVQGIRATIDAFVARNL